MNYLSNIQYRQLWQNDYNKNAKKQQLKQKSQYNFFVKKPTLNFEQWQRVKKEHSHSFEYFIQLQGKLNDLTQLQGSLPNSFEEEFSDEFKTYLKAYFGEEPDSSQKKKTIGKVAKELEFYDHLSNYSGQDDSDFGKIFKGDHSKFTDTKLAQSLSKSLDSFKRAKSIATEFKLKSPKDMLPYHIDEAHQLFSQLKKDYHMPPILSSELDRMTQQLQIAFVKAKTRSETDEIKLAKKVDTFLCDFVKGMRGSYQESYQILAQLNAIPFYLNKTEQVQTYFNLLSEPKLVKMVNHQLRDLSQVQKAKLETLLSAHALSNGSAQNPGAKHQDFLSAINSFQKGMQQEIIEQVRTKEERVTIQSKVTSTAEALGIEPTQVGVPKAFESTRKEINKSIISLRVNFVKFAEKAALATELYGTSVDLLDLKQVKINDTSVRLFKPENSKKQDQVAFLSKFSTLMENVETNYSGNMSYQVLIENQFLNDFVDAFKFSTNIKGELTPERLETEMERILSDPNTDFLAVTSALENVIRKHPDSYLGSLYQEILDGYEQLEDQYEKLVSITKKTYQASKNPFDIGRGRLSIQSEEEWALITSELKILQDQKEVADYFYSKSGSKAPRARDPISSSINNYRNGLLSGEITLDSSEAKAHHKAWAVYEAKVKSSIENTAYGSFVMQLLTPTQSLSKLIERERNESGAVLSQYKSLNQLMDESKISSADVLSDGLSVFVAYKLSSIGIKLNRGVNTAAGELGVARRTFQAAGYLNIIGAGAGVVNASDYFDNKAPGRGATLLAASVLGFGLGNRYRQYPNKFFNRAPVETIAIGKYKPYYTPGGSLGEKGITPGRPPSSKGSDISVLKTPPKVSPLKGQPKVPSKSVLPASPQPSPGITSGGSVLDNSRVEKQNNTQPNRDTVEVQTPEKIKESSAPQTENDVDIEVLNPNEQVEEDKELRRKIDELKEQYPDILIHPEVERKLAENPSILERILDKNNKLTDEGRQIIKDLVDIANWVKMRHLQNPFAFQAVNDALNIAIDQLNIEMASGVTMGPNPSPLQIRKLDIQGDDQEYLEEVLKNKKWLRVKLSAAQNEKLLTLSVDEKALQSLNLEFYTVTNSDNVQTTVLVEHKRNQAILYVDFAVASGYDENDIDKLLIQMGREYSNQILLVPNQIIDPATGEKYEKSSMIKDMQKYGDILDISEEAMHYEINVPASFKLSEIKTRKLDLQTEGKEHLTNIIGYEAWLIKRFGLSQFENLGAFTKNEPSEPLNIDAYGVTKDNLPERTVLVEHKENDQSVIYLDFAIASTRYSETDLHQILMQIKEDYPDKEILVPKDAFTPEDGDWRVESTMISYLYTVDNILSSSDNINFYKLEPLSLPTPQINKVDEYEPITQTQDKPIELLIIEEGDSGKNHIEDHFNELIKFGAVNFKKDKNRTLGATMTKEDYERKLLYYEKLSAEYKALRNEGLVLTPKQEALGQTVRYYLNHYQSYGYFEGNPGRYKVFNRKEDAEKYVDQAVSQVAQRALDSNIHNVDVERLAVIARTKPEHIENYLHSVGIEEGYEIRAIVANEYIQIKAKSQKKSLATVTWSIPVEPVQKPEVQDEYQIRIEGRALIQGSLGMRTPDGKPAKRAALYFNYRVPNTKKSGFVRTNDLRVEVVRNPPIDQVEVYKPNTAVHVRSKDELEEIKGGRKPKAKATKSKDTPKPEPEITRTDDEVIPKPELETAKSEDTPKPEPEELTEQQIAKLEAFLEKYKKPELTEEEKRAEKIYWKKYNKQIPQDDYDNVLDDDIRIEETKLSEKSRITIISAPLNIKQSAYDRAWVDLFFLSDGWHQLKLDIDQRSRIYELDNREILDSTIGLSFHSVRSSTGKESFIVANNKKIPSVLHLDFAKAQGFNQEELDAVSNKMRIYFNSHGRELVIEDPLDTEQLFLTPPSLYHSRLYNTFKRLDPQYSQSDYLAITKFFRSKRWQRSNLTPFQREALKAFESKKVSDEYLHLNFFTLDKISKVEDKPFIVVGDRGEHSILYLDFAQTSKSSPSSLSNVLIQSKDEYPSKTLLLPKKVLNPDKLTNDTDSNKILRAIYKDKTILQNYDKDYYEINPKAVITKLIEAKQITDPASVEWTPLGQSLAKLIQFNDKLFQRRKKKDSELLTKSLLNTPRYDAITSNRAFNSKIQSVKEEIEYYKGLSLERSLSDIEEATYKENKDKLEELLSSGYFQSYSRIKGQEKVEGYGEMNAQNAVRQVAQTAIESGLYNLNVRKLISFARRKSDEDIVRGIALPNSFEKENVSIHRTDENVEIHAISESVNPTKVIFSIPKQPLEPRDEIKIRIEGRVKFENPQAIMTADHKPAKYVAVEFNHRIPFSEAPLFNHMTDVNIEVMKLSPIDREEVEESLPINNIAKSLLLGISKKGLQARASTLKLYTVEGNKEVLGDISNTIESLRDYQNVYNTQLKQYLSDVKGKVPQMPKFFDRDKMNDTIRKLSRAESPKIEKVNVNKLFSFSDEDEVEKYINQVMPPATRAVDKNAPGDWNVSVQKGKDPLTGKEAIVGITVSPPTIIEQRKTPKPTFVWTIPENDPKSINLKIIRRVEKSGDEIGEAPNQQGELVKTGDAVLEMQWYPLSDEELQSFENLEGGKINTRIKVLTKEAMIFSRAYPVVRNNLPNALIGFEDERLTLGIEDKNKYPILQPGIFYRSYSKNELRRRLSEDIEKLEELKGQKKYNSNHPIHGHIKAAKWMVKIMSLKPNIRIGQTERTVDYLHSQASKIGAFRVSPEELFRMNKNDREKYINTHIEQPKPWHVRSEKGYDPDRKRVTHKIHVDQDYLRTSSYDPISLTWIKEQGKEDYTLLVDGKIPGWEDFKGTTARVRLEIKGNSDQIISQSSYKYDYYKRSPSELRVYPIYSNGDEEDLGSLNELYDAYKKFMEEDRDYVNRLYKALKKLSDE